MPWQGVFCANRLNLSNNGKVGIVIRLQGLDIARFIAFTGMVLVNFRIAAHVAPTGNLASSVTNLLEGRAAALFVVLAGVGISLARPTAALLAKRGIFLLAIGLLNQLVFPADILHYYGAYFLVAILALRLTSRGLILATLAILVVSFIALITMNYEAGWNWATFEYRDFWTLKGFVRNLFYNGWHPVFPWVSFLLFGMFLGRLSLSSPATQIRLVIFGGLWAVFVVLLSLFLSQDPELAEITGLAPIPPGPLYIFSGIGTSTVFIGAILNIVPLLEKIGVANPLARAGRQSLTLYVAHILIGMGFLEWMGWLETGRLSSIEIFLLSLVFVAACALYTSAWAKFFKRGPLEALMRRTTE